MPKAKRKSNPEVPTGNLEGDQTQQVEVDREEPGPPSPKRKSAPWQETLLTLIANQQEQIALLRKSNTAGNAQHVRRWHSNCSGVNTNATNFTYHMGIISPIGGTLKVPVSLNTEGRRKCD
ncbi:hypothetical protein MTP99_002875 [Tenebrio molitor]|nr:hypothetical protein MTP99_002875 [Tenebrio molitor]